LACRHCGTFSGSSHVSVDSSKTLSSPHFIKRGCPSTQVIKRWQSPGTGNLGNGQNRAAGVFDGTFAGHLKPTTAIYNKNDIFIMVLQ